MIAIAIRVYCRRRRISEAVGCFEAPELVTTVNLDPPELSAINSVRAISVRGYGNNHLWARVRVEIRNHWTGEPDMGRVRVPV